MFESAAPLVLFQELETALADPAVHADLARARKVGRRYAELMPIIKALDEHAGSQMILRLRKSWLRRTPRWPPRRPSWRRGWARLPSGSRDCWLRGIPTTPQMR